MITPFVVGRPYSSDEIDFLQSMAKEVQDPKKRIEVAAAIGRSPWSVYAQSIKLGFLSSTRKKSDKSEIDYVERKPDLEALEKQVCTRCGDPLVIEKDPLDFFDFRLYGEICGHSFYYLKEDFEKISVRRGVVKNGEEVAEGGVCSR